jgi:hypothetical protein
VTTRTCRRSRTRALVLGSLLAGALASGCLLLAPASYVQTGRARPALPDDARVRVFLTGSPQPPFEEIGVVEVESSRLADRVRLAQDQARRRGGNAIVLMSSYTDVSTSTSSRTVETKDKDGKVIATTRVPVTSTSTAHVQTFVIVHLPAAGDAKVAAAR